MRKFLKRFPFKKVFVYLFILFYTFFPSLHAVGITLETSILDDTEVDESQDILNKGISDPEWIAKPLYTYEDGIYTVDLVQERQYTYPDNEDVRVMFTSVTEEGNLTINKVALSEKEKVELNTTDDYAWEITSTMSNGSFEYNLTLPNTLDSTDVEVMYTEDGEVYESIDNVEVNEGVIYIEGLDHFTVFVLTEKLPLETKEEKDEKRKEEKCQVWIKEVGTSTYFNTIQEAIGKSAEGNTIYVEEGTCVENIVVDKSLTLTGEGKIILIPENSSQPIIKISTDNVTVEKFVLQKSETYAILVTGASSVTLKGNSFLNNYMGVLIRQSTNVLIEDNSFNKGSLGLSIGHTRDAKDSSTGNTVKGNIFSNLNPSGGATPIISLIKTSKNTIENNKIAKNRTQGGGISLSGSNNNIIKGNGITDNNVIPFGEGLVYGVGIKLFSSEGNSIIENTIINHNSGIDLSASGRNSIEENILDSNWHGIYLRGDDSTKNTITKNQITNNKTVGIDAPPKGTGIYFFQSTSNNDTEIKYNNFSGNEDKAIRYEGKKVLDATLNWWGHISGPSGTANGLGDAVSSNVLFEEWLCEPYENDETVSTSQNGGCKLEPPIQVGYYAKGSNTLIGCQDAYTNINGISIHWSDDNYFGQKNIKYERQYKVGNGSWKGSEIFTNLYTDYRAFGEKEGTDGIYGSQVRVFYDANDDGKYTLGEPASDWSNACSITYDKTPPKVKITSPIQDDLLKGVIEIKGHVSDNNLSHYNIAIYPAGVDVEDFSKRIEQNTKYTSEFDDKPLYSWNTTNGNFPDGEYQIRLAARDLAGNRDLNSDSKDVITVYVDNTSPSSTITSPSNEFITNQKMNIKGNTSDNHSVNKVTISYTNWSSEEEDCNYENWKELVVLENTEVKLPFNWSRDAWSPEDGIYCIKAQGTDLAGNIENTSIIKNIIYDTEKPEISLVNLINGVLGEITADGGLSGLESIKVKVGDGEWEDYKEGMNLNDMANRTPGTYTVYIKVTDKAGNESETQRTFIIPAPFSDTLGEVLGAFTEPFTPQPVQAQTKTSATTQLLAQSTQEEELPEKEEVEVETEVQEETEDIQPKEVKSEDEEEEEEKKGGIKWWVYILILLPLLFFFFILYKRRKEEEEKQL